MTKPNKACPKCHGTGWEPKPGTLAQRPCPDCSKGQPVRAYPFDRRTFARGSEAGTPGTAGSTDVLSRTAG